MTASSRCFLLLQGPAGPFFRRLGRRLLHQGHHVISVSIHVGDKVFNRSGERIAYRGTFDDWGAFLTDLRSKKNITDIVVYNDCRPYHRVALELLRAQGVRVHIFEEGYFRPHRITYEADGVNGFSPFCKEGFPNADYIVPSSQHMPEHEPLPPTLRHIYINTFLYYLFAGALNPIFYPNYKFHRICHPGIELFSRMKRFVLYPYLSLISSKRQKKLLSAEKRYYVALLQLSGDTQIKVHSPFKNGGMKELIAFVIADFARHAPKDHCLVIKNHPLDNGMEKLEKFTAACASGHHISDRIIFIDKGHLPELIKHAEGVIATNSTAGTSALHHGTPIICLGDALYVREGLATQHGKDGANIATFWRRPTPPNKKAFERFRDVMHARTQIYGNYYTKKGVEKILEILMQYRPFTDDNNASDINAPDVCLCKPKDPEK